MTNSSKISLLFVTFLILMFSLLFTFAAYFTAPYAAHITVVLYMILWYGFFTILEKLL